MASLKYFAQKSEDGYPIPSTMMGFKETPAADLIEIPAQDTVAAPGQTVKKPASGLRYFVRRDAQGKIIPNSLITGTKKPQGLVYEFKVVEGTPTPAPSGTAAYVSRNQMMDTPVCSMETSNLSITWEEGKTFSASRYIYGDFASIGAYFTPADPNDGMAQPPTFAAAIIVDGKRESKAFRLISAGVAENFNSMLGGPDASAVCPTYWVVDQYFSCDAPSGVNVNFQVTNGNVPQVGKYYNAGLNVGALLIKSQSATPLMMATTFNPTTAYSTCAEALPTV